MWLLGKTSSFFWRGQKVRCSNSQNVLSSFCLSSLTLSDRVCGTSLWEWRRSRKSVVAKRSRRHPSNSCCLCPSASSWFAVSEPNVSLTHLTVDSNECMRDTPQCTCKPKSLNMESMTTTCRPWRQGALGNGFRGPVLGEQNSRRACRHIL